MKLSPKKSMEPAHATIKRFAGSVRRDKEKVAGGGLKLEFRAPSASIQSAFISVDRRLKKNLWE